MARDYEHDEWIPWYVEDTPGWCELSLAARGAMEGIARKLNRKTGRLALRRGLQGLTVLLHTTWEQLEPALAELLDKGKVRWDEETSTLYDPEYVERKRRGTAERVAEHRARKKGDGGPEAPDVTHVTLQPLHALPETPVTQVTLPLVSSSLISSDSESQADRDRAREGPDDVEGDTPPAWWPSALERIHEDMGETLDPLIAWHRYSGHRALKGLPAKRKDAIYWLTTVMVPELKNAREEAFQRKQRDAERTQAIVKARQPPEQKPVPSATPILRERERWAAEAASPEQSAAAAAQLRRVLGGVGS